MDAAAPEFAIVLGGTIPKAAFDSFAPDENAIRVKTERRRKARSDGGDEKAHNLGKHGTPLSRVVPTCRDTYVLRQQTGGRDISGMIKGKEACGKDRIAGAQSHCQTGTCYRWTENSNAEVSVPRVLVAQHHQLIMETLSS